MADTVDFFQIYYEDKYMTSEARKAHIFPFATPILNNTLTPFFENTLTCDLVMKSKANKIAVCSWALKDKMSMRIPPRRELSEEVLQEDFDVMSFSKNSSDHAMLTALNEWHPGSVDILKLIWAKLGLKMTMKPRFPIYQNAFCAKAEVYLAYVHGFLLPAMELMEDDDEIRKLCWQNSNYTRTTLNKPIDLDRIESFLGVRHYPMHPFLLERCFSLWIDDKNLKIIYL